MHHKRSEILTNTHPDKLLFDLEEYESDVAGGPVLNAGCATVKKKLAVE